MMHNLFFNVPICQYANVLMKCANLQNVLIGLNHKNLVLLLIVSRHRGNHFLFKNPSLLETIILPIIFSISFNKNIKCLHSGYDFEC